MHTEPKGETMYNATAYKMNAEGKTVSVEAVEVDEAGRVVRACGLWSPFNGTDRFDDIWRSAQFSFVSDICIVKDGARAYRNRLSGLSLPPAYATA